MYELERTRIILIKDSIGAFRLLKENEIYKYKSDVKNKQILLQKTCKKNLKFQP